MTNQSSSDYSSQKFDLPAHGWVGLSIFILGQLVYLLKLQPYHIFTTPINWTGYILFMDGLIYRRTKQSLILTRTGEFIIMIPISVILWLLFEIYNVLIKNWYYTGLPDNLTLRYFGYTWSFATIWPAIFVTAEFLDLILPKTKPYTGYRFVRNYYIFWSVLTGLICVIYPFYNPSPYLFGFVWVGFILLLDPINYAMARPSLTEEWQKGSNRKFWILMMAGYLCGLLWEYWNHFAGAQWHYTIPFGPKIYIFEMPVLGFLGFGPFAVECYILYSAVTGLPGWGTHPILEKESITGGILKKNFRPKREVGS